MKTRNEFRMGLRLLIMALVFLAMSCESDGEGGDCLGSTDALIVGFGDGCGTGCKMTGSGCLGECLMGSNDGCGAGEGCIGDCGGCDGCDDCGDCGETYRYEGEVVDGAVQVSVTDSLFQFVEASLLDIVKAAAGNVLNDEEYCQRCAAGVENWDCGACDEWVTHCLAPMDINDQVISVKLCNRGYNCNVDGSPGGPNNGCRIHMKMGDMTLNTVERAANHTRMNVRVPLKDLYAWIPSSVGGNCTIRLGQHQGSQLYAQIGLDLRVNPNDGRVELYVGKETMDINLSGMSDSNTDCFWANIAGGVKSLANTAIGAIGGVTCRGCQTNADCAPGSTCGAAKVCTRPNGTNQQCAGLQLGADLKVDAASLLASIDPGAEGLLGVSAFLGSYTSAVSNGLQLGGRLGGNAEAPSLCVPFQPSPITPDLDDCRSGSNCRPLQELNGGGTIMNPATGEMDAFHIGVGVAMAGLNQVLWSAYNSGVLCLSLGGESAGLEMLNTELFSTFIGSLGSLTYNASQPLMVQLRPQKAPYVEFLESAGQGAELLVKIPELEIDFYTVVDQRYARIFTLATDLELPLGLKGESNMLEVAIGDLANVIVPGTTSASNIEMVSASQVQSLVNNLPTLIGALTGVLGDELIPPIEIPEFSGIKVKFVGPGLTVLEENDLPAALGLFANLDITPEDLGGILSAMEPVIQNLQVDIRDPKQLREDIAARRRADESFSYTDLMPKIVAHMGVTGVDLDASEIEYAYSINHGPWSFWKRGPQLRIDNPMLAAEAKFDVRITARVAGDASTGSASHAEFSFVNDYSAPTVTLEVNGALVHVAASDNVYSRDELSMQYRIDGGTWTKLGEMQDIDLLAPLMNGPVALDVVVVDPSGNTRRVRQTFGETEKSARLASANATQETDGGCSTSQGNGGLAAVLALLALVFLRRRESGTAEANVTAASPFYIALAILSVLLLGLGSSGCKSKDVGAACLPACSSAEMCIDGGCVAIACDGDEDCSALDKCIDGKCVGQQSCEYADDCDYGHICKDGLCFPSECTTSEDCTDIVCTLPELPYCEYDDYASVEAGECICSAGVEMGRHGGWLNVLALDEGETTVALAFSEQYGDLIFGLLQEDGNFEWDFVDGVPEGPIVRPPSGLRYGIVLPGDEAGRYVSAVLDHVDGEPVIHMAYQYRVRGEAAAALRYARAERSAGSWDWTFIDVDALDVSGMFPSVFLTKTEPVVVEGEEPAAPEGGVGIFFMARDIAVENEDMPMQYFSNISVAYASVLAPTEAADFQIREVDQVESDIACGGLCPANSFCAVAENICLSSASGCGECGEGEVCLATSSGASCVLATAATDGGFSVTQRGTGLFSSSVVGQDGSVHVAYYDQVHGNLMYAKLAILDGAADLSSPPVVIDGEVAGRSTGDVGRWTRIHELASGGVAIFYEDAGRAELRAAIVQGGAVNITVLDDGHYANDDRSQVQSNRVGSSIYTRALEAGGFEVFYQDTTNGVVRRIEWTNLSAAPVGHPHAVFGAVEGLERELGSSEEEALDPSMIAVANNDGAVGFFTNVVEGIERTIFASKQINMPRGGSSTVPMHVTTGIIGHDVPDDEEPGDGEATP